MNTTQTETGEGNALRDKEPLDGSLIANEIARKAREDRLQQALWEREHDAFHFERPITA